MNPQMQNPNMMPPQMGGGPSPLDGAVVGKKGHWALVVIVLILVVGFFVAWMYVKQMDFGFQLLQPLTQVQRDAAEDAMISGEIQSADPGNFDSDFQAIDNDLNSL